VRKRSIVWTAMALAPVGALLPAGVASAAPARTQVAIQPEQGGFSGYVSSSNRSCANGRKVLIYKTQRGKKPRLVASDIAQANGDRYMWSKGVPGPGRYFAAVKATRSCAGAKSRTASPQPAPADAPPAGAGA